MPLLRSTLVSIADEAMHVMLVTDADGHDPLARGRGLGCCTPPTRSASCPGTRWTEDAIGTNAMGTTLAVDAPVQIHSAEHLVRTYHAWTCAAAPVHDPDTGAILGAIDISGPLHTVHPAMMQLVSATAQLAENQLRVRLAIADERLRVRNMPHLASLRGQAGALVTPSGRIIAGEPYGVLARARRAAGRRRPGPCSTTAARWWSSRSPRATCCARRSGAPPRRSARRCRCGSLARAPRRRCSTAGRSRSRCAPPSCSPRSPCTPTASPPSGWRCCSTARTATPPRCAARSSGCAASSAPTCCAPARTGSTPPSTPTSQAVRRALRAGRPADALRACAGPLLPRSDAPAIRELRDELEAGLRGAVLDSDDLDLLAEFAEHPLGRDDLEVHDRLLALLPPSDPRRTPIARRAHLLEA